MCDRCNADVPWIPEKCPKCGGRPRSTGESAWCTRCGWGIARYPYDMALIERDAYLRLEASKKQRQMERR